MASSADDLSTQRSQPPTPRNASMNEFSNQVDPVYTCYPHNAWPQENYYPDALQYQWMQQQQQLWNQGAYGQYVHPAPTNWHASQGNTSQNSQRGIYLEPTDEIPEFPIIITADTEVTESAPSYAQITKKNAEPVVHTAPSPRQHREHNDGSVSHRTAASDYRGISNESQPRKVYVPRDHLDYTNLFQKLTSSPLNHLFIGCRHEDRKTAEDLNNAEKMTSIRPEFTLIASPDGYYARHFHDMDPMDLCEFHLNFACILDNMLAPSAIVIPFGSMRKDHPSPHCFLQSTEFAQECSRIGVDPVSPLAMNFEDDVECKDITRVILGICNGQLDFLKHTSLLQAMRSGIDLMLLYFLVYDCFRSDFVNFEIEFRSIHEAPSQIVIRSSKRSVCKRKVNPQRDATTTGIHIRVAHNTVHWKSLPDAPISVTHPYERQTKVSTVAPKEVENVTTTPSTELPAMPADPGQKRCPLGFHQGMSLKSHIENLDIPKRLEDVKGAYECLLQSGKCLYESCVSSEIPKLTVNVASLKERISFKFEEASKYVRESNLKERAILNLQKVSQYVREKKWSTVSIQVFESEAYKMCLERIKYLQTVTASTLSIAESQAQKCITGLLASETVDRWKNVCLGCILSGVTWRIIQRINH